MHTYYIRLNHIGMFYYRSFYNVIYNNNLLSLEIDKKLIIIY